MKWLRDVNGYTPDDPLGTGGVTTVQQGKWTRTIQAQPTVTPRSFDAYVIGGTSGNTVTVEIHASNSPLISIGSDTLIGTITISLGTANSNGVTGYSRIPDLSAVPYDYVCQNVTAIPSGALYTMMGGV